MTPETPICDRCKQAPKARHVRAPRELNLCWQCFDRWRRWYLGAAYRYAVPIETLRGSESYPKHGQLI
jgi:hypothetical protein